MMQSLCGYFQLLACLSSSTSFSAWQNLECAFADNACKHIAFSPTAFTICSQSGQIRNPHLLPTPPPPSPFPMVSYPSSTEIGQSQKLGVGTTALQHQSWRPDPLEIQAKLMSTTHGWQQSHVVQNLQGVNKPRVNMHKWCLPYLCCQNQSLCPDDPAGFPGQEAKQAAGAGRSWRGKLPAAWPTSLPLLASSCSCMTQQSL